VRNAWNTVLKSTGKHTQATNSERSGVARVIVDTDTPRMTEETLVNERICILYLFHADVQLHRPKSVVEMAAVTIDMIRTNHSSTENVLKMFFPLEYLAENGTFQRKLVLLWIL
jgi:hypothetical protein